MSTVPQLPEHLRKAIHEAIGHASVCWSDVANAGVFDVAEALRVAAELSFVIACELESVRAKPRRSKGRAR